MLLYAKAFFKGLRDVFLAPKFLSLLTVRVLPMIAKRHPCWLAATIVPDLA